MTEDLIHWIMYVFNNVCVCVKMTEFCFYCQAHVKMRPDDIV